MIDQKKRDASRASRAAGDAEGDALPVELMTLLYLDPGGAGSVSAQTAASVCQHDLGLLLRLIRICEEDVLAWREAAQEATEEADWDEADACQREANGWQTTVHLLQRALRVVVGADAA